MFLSSEIITNCNVAVLQKGQRDIAILHLAVDSRKIIQAAHTLFFAIKTSNRNGHDYISNCYQLGIRHFIISDEIELTNYPDAWFWKSENSKNTLQEISTSHRKKYTIPVIGITGSNGKTIVKEWLNQLLEPEENICRSPKSYNSQIGVPLSVWQMNDEHSLGIFEAGISECNEMEVLEKIILPTEGILTNIGDAHQEGFESKVIKLKEKLNLFKNANSLIYCNNNAEITNEINAFLIDKNCK
ncbi:MAG: bifunctional UDP-N-acetylmuramoyl-tripeptide:D-alanyl-D-alanine ligase/alanine racemase, partial [Chitinophagaceae bacterium]|nr:bifunctional UDP-N-acetylmuramoyl-tripeptide:D-alanyl-D-alanine ligase/alanine racemase [Chitinophagaceae bacterium]